MFQTNEILRYKKATPIHRSWKLIIFKFKRYYPIKIFFIHRHHLNPPISVQKQYSNKNLNLLYKYFDFSHKHF